MALCIRASKDFELGLEITSQLRQNICTKIPLP
ncbi:hypothetical protein CCACVL1_24769 [Corchorus capsularis]|uniref:Uncharacterized protein n=1 Tax=Corchorus capsularis TaxID=210143 RepID=A0A1R3GN58_COCAP|nr:hypothetical protein CCACVL1_24769 [Corchorus capsularis]